jgi:methionine-rich copper-binding protein CopC
VRLRRLADYGFILAGLLWVQAPAWAEAPRVVETGPANHGVVSGSGEDFFVRCDQPVDHMQSMLVIKRGDDVVETLHPRLKTEPNVLFARSAGLAPGDYKLVWMVKTLDGKPVDAGDIAFKVEAGK